jgi:very-short-patch-repair endonuclease
VSNEDWVRALLFQLKAVNARQAALAIREHRFHPSRRWRFDCAWPFHMVALEVDGGSWVGGRHTTGSGFEKDCEKLSEAAALGWRVLRVTPRQIESGQALGWLERALGA